MANNCNGIAYINNNLFEKSDKKSDNCTNDYVEYNNYIECEYDENYSSISNNIEEQYEYIAVKPFFSGKDIDNGKSSKMIIIVAVLKLIIGRLIRLDICLVKMRFLI